MCVRVCLHVYSVNHKQIFKQNNKNYLYSFNSTIDVQAQIFKEDLTVGQMNYRNLGPKMRHCDRSVTVNLIN